MFIKLTSDLQIRRYREKEKFLAPNGAEGKLCDVNDRAILVKFHSPIELEGVLGVISTKDLKKNIEVSLNDKHKNP